jgi:hypothetical protein
MSSRIELVFVERCVPLRARLTRLGSVGLDAQAGRRHQVRGSLARAKGFSSALSVRELMLDSGKRKASRTKVQGQTLLGRLRRHPDGDRPDRRGQRRARSCQEQFPGTFLWPKIGLSRTLYILRLFRPQPLSLPPIGPSHKWSTAAKLEQIRDLFVRDAARICDQEKGGTSNERDAFKKAVHDIARSLNK